MTGKDVCHAGFDYYKAGGKGHMEVALTPFPRLSQWEHRSAHLSAVIVPNLQLLGT